MRPRTSAPGVVTVESSSAVTVAMPGRLRRMSRPLSTTPSPVR